MSPPKPRGSLAARASPRPSGVAARTDGPGRASAPWPWCPSEAGAEEGAPSESERLGSAARLAPHRSACSAPLPCTAWLGLGLGLR